MIAIFLLSHQPRVPNVPSLSGDVTSVVGHFGAYFMLATMLWWAMGALGVAPRHRVMLAFAGAVLYGVTDEWHQSFVPGRQPDILDIATDAIGAATGLFVIDRITRTRWLGRLIPR